MSAGVAMSPRSSISPAVRSPRCSMSMAPREAKWTMRASTCAGHCRFGQRATASSSGRTSARPAHGTVARHHEGAFGPVAQAGDGGDHLGDHLARAPDHHRVANQHALAHHLLGVVQRGHRDRHAAHAHRLEHREGGDGAGAAHADLDVAQLGVLFLGRELVGDGPARELRRRAQLARIGEAIDLDDRAVDLVLQRVAARFHVGHERAHVVQRGQRLGLGVGAQPQLAQVGEGGAVAGGDFAVDADQAVEVDAQRPAGGDGRILLAQQPGRGVARVGEQRFAGGAHLQVDAIEVGQAQEHLAAHLQPVGGRIAAQARRDGPDGAHVGGHVLADVAVAARGAAHQPAALVADGNGDAVDLRLAHVGWLAAQTLHDAVTPGHQLFVVEHVVQREQRATNAEPARTARPRRRPRAGWASRASAARGGAAPASRSSRNSRSNSASETSGASST